VLVLAGGSNNGAWEAGVIWGLVHYGQPEDFAWDSVSGVSAGAINTGAAANWEKGTEVEYSEYMSDQWAQMTNKQLFKPWSLNPIDWLLHEQSVLDDSEAIKTLDRIYSYNGRVIKRHFTVSAVDVNTGEYVPMTEKNTPFDNLAQSCMSSASIPGVFPPQQLNGYVFMDGGTVWNLNLNTAVQQCLDDGFTSENIIVDVAICGYTSFPETDIEKNSMKNWQTARSVRDYYLNSNSLWEQAKAYPGINMRYNF